MAKMEVTFKPEEAKSWWRVHLAVGSQEGRNIWDFSLRVLPDGR